MIDNFSMEFVAGNVKAATAGIKSADLWQFPPDQLRIVPDFNVRANSEKNQAKIRAIADSIKANGYYRDKALAGYVGKDSDGKDVVFVTGGHRRHAAVVLAISEGAEVPFVPVITSPKGTNMEDLTVALKEGNESEPLTIYECAIVCKRLAGFGWSSADISRRLGYASGQYVDNLLALASAPLALREMVINETVSATAAMDAIRKHGAKALDVLKEGLAKAGGKKVTAKNLPGAEFKKVLRKQAEPLWTAVGRLRDDPAFLQINEEVRKEILSIVSTIVEASIK